MTHALADFMKPFFSHYLPTQRGLSINTIASYRDGARSKRIGKGTKADRPLTRRLGGIAQCRRIGHRRTRHCTDAG